MTQQQFRPWAILLAAGQGNRLKAALNETSKQFLEWQGLPLFWHSALALAAVPQIEGIIIALPEDGLAEAEELCRACSRKKPLGIEYRIVAGGTLRQDSVRKALAALPGQPAKHNIADQPNSPAAHVASPGCTHVLVHDSARPFVSAALIRRVLDALRQKSSGSHGSHAVIPGLELSDTAKIVSVESEVLSTPDRASLRLIQTPQGFERSALQTAHEAALRNGWQVTDDAALLERCQMPVLVVPGEASNRKITTPEDLELLMAAKQPSPCTGFGYDVHSYGGNRPFVLGGVRITSTEIMLRAHSDGDVLIHALIDALLGCVGGGDIGGLFPDNDPKYENISSSILLSETLEIVRQAGFELAHADLTVVAQTPKIAPFRKEIAKNIAHLMQLDEKRVNLKATTEEGLGFTGAGQGIKAMAVVTGLFHSVS
ncbi:MAG: 2-C-methyl-D-erythritol 4-phosphate cytidylyltransferase [Deltaproteobacteria bacterium]|jgi:2-C-methyl-D-erythritol 4-phosphate cytidylyltransferase/2-C-methyl-D-erythritol 2,4-cyclodiphosphate synthase|nr:2-C-methyl-D-erythritol 4-phosphate cytidylyltransferase [Deltaproteobacteria bacterium]